MARVASGNEELGQAKELLVNSRTIEELRQAQAVVLGGFKNQLQQLMFSSDFSKVYIMQELSVNLYR